MTTKAKTETTVQFCVACETELTNGECFDVNCPAAQDAATSDADRTTAKTTTKAAARMQGSPRAFTSSGRVD